MSQAKLAPRAEQSEVEAEAPLLSQILEAMERRDNARQYKPQPIEIKTFDELDRWAHIAAQSGMVPKDYVGKPDAIIIAVDMGAEVGLKRMQSLQGIAVINGRPTIWGDAMWALILSQPSLEDTREWFEGSGDDYKAVCEIKRRGRSLVRQEFSVAKAKTAKLWGKTGSNGQPTPWVTSPDRMMQMRARAFSARDTYADALKGLAMAEEVMDYDEPKATYTPPQAAVTLPEKPPSKPPSEKTLQAVDGVLNTLTGCESPDEWLVLDDKWRAYREKLAINNPDLSEKVEAAFAETRARLFPDSADEAPADDEAPQPDPLSDFAADLLQQFQHAKTTHDLAQIIANAAVKSKLKKIETERPGLNTQVRAAYDQRAADFAPATGG